MGPGRTLLLSRPARRARGPLWLLAVLQEALTRLKVDRLDSSGERLGERGILFEAGAGVCRFTKELGQEHGWILVLLAERTRERPTRADPVTLFVLTDAELGLSACRRHEDNPDSHTSNEPKGLDRAEANPDPSMRRMLRQNGACDQDLSRVSIALRHCDHHHFAANESELWSQASNR